MHLTNGQQGQQLQAVYTLQFTGETGFIQLLGVYSCV